MHNYIETTQQTAFSSFAKLIQANNSNGIYIKAEQKSLSKRNIQILTTDKYCNKLENRPQVINNNDKNLINYTKII